VSGPPDSGEPEWTVVGLFEESDDSPYSPIVVAIVAGWPVVVGHEDALREDWSGWWWERVRAPDAPAAAEVARKASRAAAEQRDRDGVAW
jgi:hypothetical protein